VSFDYFLQAICKEIEQQKCILWDRCIQRYCIKRNNKHCKTQHLTHKNQFKKMRDFNFLVILICVKMLEVQSGVLEDMIHDATLLLMDNSLKSQDFVGQLGNGVPGMPFISHEVHGITSDFVERFNRVFLIMGNSTKLMLFLQWMKKPFMMMRYVTIISNVQTGMLVDQLHYKSEPPITTLLGNFSTKLAFDETGIDPEKSTFTLVIDQQRRYLEKENFTAAHFHYPPFSTLHKTQNGIIRGGVETNIIREVALSLGMRPVFQAPFDGPTWRGAISDVQRGFIDMAAGQYFFTLDRLRICDFTNYYDIDAYCFLVRLPDPQPNWLATVLPFQWTVWLCIVITKLSVAATYCVWLTLRPDRKYPLSKALIIYTGTIFNQSWKSKPE
jgi:hypothetical protein